MIFPCLILDSFLNKKVKVVINTEDIDEDGAPISYNFEGLCNYQSACKTLLTQEQKIVQITGKLYFKGDIIPELPEISSGYAEIDGIKRTIQTGSKAKNPDGSINFTYLEVL